MVVFFIVESFSVLHLSVLTNIGNAIIGYMPYILASALILLACYVCDGLAGKALLKENHTVLPWSAELPFIQSASSWY